MNLEMGGLLGDEHTEIQNERERLKNKRFKKDEDLDNEEEDEK